MNILALICARGGSKRIPKKNIKQMCGKPLIAWSIEAAIKSKSVNKVVVSTDDLGITSVAQKYGAEVPFTRPPELSLDTDGLEPVIRHAVEWLQDHQSYRADIIVFYPPTNPLKRAEDIDESVQILTEFNADSVVAVSNANGNNNPHWILKRENNGDIKLATGEPLRNIIDRSQDLPSNYYIRNDVLYTLKPKNLYQQSPSLYGDKVKLLIMDEIFNTDINSPEDWFITSNKLARLMNSNAVGEPMVDSL